jgi:uncharacterized membrane protein
MLDRGYKEVLIMPIGVALWFLNGYVFQYLDLDRDKFGIYWPRREWLYVHLLAGMLALLLGPVQLWLGLNRQGKLLHRMLGSAYTISVFVSAGAAFYLARHTDFGWVFGMGLTTMAVAWVISTIFATVAVSRHLKEQRREWMIRAVSAGTRSDQTGRFVQQHREWMIRSYVLTFGFVTFRMFTYVLQVAGIGTTLEQVTAASWFSWSVPLLITECLIQGRKILSSSRQAKTSSATASALAQRDGGDQFDLFEQQPPAEPDPRLPLVN